MTKLKKLIIACDGESASGKSTASKLISKKYKLLHINSGLFYRYCSKLLIQHNPKNVSLFLKKKLKLSSYKKISRQNLHSEKISNHAAKIARIKKIRKIVNDVQINIIKNNYRICVEGRDIASKILIRKPKYDIAFYFKCSLNIASKRRWLDLNKNVSLSEVKNSLIKRTNFDKNRKNSPLIKVKDAILIRTNKLSKKQVVAKMSKHIDKIINKK